MTYLHRQTSLDLGGRRLNSYHLGMCGIVRGISGSCAFRRDPDEVQWKIPNKLYWFVL